MKQQQFAIRQKSEELIKEIVEIWRKGDQKENLEGMEKDPIFGLLVTALSYRTSEIENDIEMLKYDVINELSRRMIPDYQCRATPAATLVTTSILGNLSETTIGSSSQFTLSGTSYRFMPLFDTLIVNGAIESVSRMDGRRWMVRLVTKDPLSTLKGLSLFLETKEFTDLSVSLDGVELPIIKPWDYANLPLSKSFSTESKFYNVEESFAPLNKWLDISSQLDSKLFYVGYSKEQSLRLSEREHLDLIFEFSGIDENFELTKQRIKINTFPIVNVEEQWVDISNSNPVARLLTKGDGDKRLDFIGLLPPAEDSNDYINRLTLREVGGDRFSQSSLFSLMKSVVDRFSSDYYAYQDIPELRNGAKLQQLHRSLTSILKDVGDANPMDRLGCYVLLNRDIVSDSESSNFRVRYLTTSAEQVNYLLSSDSQFTPAKSLSLAITTSIATPLLGGAPITDENARRQVAKYSILTHDRLVTPSDVKTFCIMKLEAMYGIDSKLINSISVAPRLVSNNRVVKYVMEVKISIEQTLFVKRTLTNITHIEHMLSRMMAVRSVGLFDFDIKIIL